MEDPLTNPAYLLFATMTPILVALLKQSGLPKSANALIALVVYIVVGALAVVFSGVPVTADNLVPAITVMALVGSAAYQLFWNQIGGDESVDDQLTRVTSVVR